jgi:hypothetical protein
LVDAHDVTLRLECLLLQAKMSHETARRWGPAIAVYEMLWLAALLYVLFRFCPKMGPGSGADVSPCFALVGCAVWGALGGIVAALFGLIWHWTKRDFDRSYLAWYFLKPVLGLLLGPLVYLFVGAGLTATQSNTANIEKHDLLYLGAFVVGFGERFFLRLIDRVATAVFGPVSGPTAGSAPPPRAVGPAGAPKAEPPEAPEAEPTEAPKPGLAQEPEATGIIRVRITGPSPEALSDLSVRLLQDDEEIEARVSGPDEKGVFLFTDLAAGAYQIEASKEGWEQAAPVAVNLTPARMSADEEVVLKKAE